MSDAEYGLVMPFVVCASQGGPYEDDAFVGGYECGQIDTALSLRQPIGYRQVHTTSLPQLDLIAMRHGYRLLKGEDNDGWTEISVGPWTGRVNS